MAAAVVWTVAGWLLEILTVVVAIPTAVVSLEIVFGVFGFKELVQLRYRSQGRVAVLVPAHNEGHGLADTLKDIEGQLQPHDRLLVVADNCSDDTAIAARASGAEVVERNEPMRIGKGYALDWGLRHLEIDPPEIVVIIDADCRLARGTIDHLAETCSLTGRPIQARYLMGAPALSRTNYGVAEFAWRVKNWLRPLGMCAVGLPCQLLGAGMAFPWRVIRGVDLASGWIVEDLKLGLDLTAAGHPPLFCSSALVTSEFAATAYGSKIQRSRWEHGHIMTILKKAPGVLYTAIASGNWKLVALTFDLAVPPLSLLVIMLTLTFGLTAATVKLSQFPFIVTTICIAVLAGSLFLAWTRFGRDVLPLRSALSIPNYVLRKIGLYSQILFGKAAPQWIRTERVPRRAGR